MSTVPEVLLRELAAVAKLVGETNNSSIAVDGSGRRLLRGRFALQVRDRISEFVDFTAANAEVLESGGVVSIRSIGRTRFTFTPHIVVQQQTKGPWLAASRATLFVSAQANARVLLSLDDASVSMIPDLAPAPGGKLHFPTAGGPRSTPLAQSAMGEGPMFGYFVLPLAEGGLGVRFGGLSGSAAVDHHAVVSAVVPRDAVITFRIDEAAAAFARGDEDDDVAPQPLMIRDSNSLFGLTLAVADSTTVRLDRNLGDGRSVMRAETIAIGEGWLSATEMHAKAKRVAISRIHTTQDGDATQIVGSPSRVRFHMPLEQNDRTALHPDAPHFAYRDASIEQRADARAVAPNASEHHFGVRLRGLHSSRGGQAKLDANWATVTLHGSKLELASGDRVRVRGRDRQSMLLPKPDPDDPGRRTLAIPAGVAELLCECDRVPTVSPIVLDTSKPAAERLRMKIGMNVPPSGTPGATAATSDPQGVARAFTAPQFSRWSLAPKDQPMMDFRVTDDGVYPAAGVGWPQRFDGASTAFGLIEHPGSGLVMNPPPAARGVVAVAAPERTQITTISVGPAQNEILAYASLVAKLLVRDKAIRYLEGLTATVDDDNVQLRFNDLTDAKIFKDRSVDGLLAVFFDADGEAAMKQWIDDNSVAGQSALVWPLATGLAIVLRDRDGRSAFELARGRGAQRPGMAIDSSSREAVEFADFGWNAQDRAGFAKEALLWPTLSNRSNARLDPTADAWRGVLFRDLALTLPIPDDVSNNAPEFARNFYREMNDRLKLDYGWKDETGATWKGGFNVAGGFSIAPLGWEQFLDIRINRFATRGASGRVVSADGEVEVRLPKIIDRATNKPFAVTGNFALNLAAGLQLERIEIAPSQGASVATTSIPGFEKVELVRFSTDLKTMEIALRLIPDATIATILPFLGGNQSIDLKATVPLSNNAVTNWAFTLRSEIQTNLFGRWPVTIQGASLNLGAVNELTLHARVNLGLPEFSSVGVRLAFREEPGSWSFDIALDEIEGRIDIGDFRLRGALSWSDRAAAQKRVPAGEIANAHSREFWGEIELQTGGLIDTNVDAKLMVRIGNEGELSYWIAALSANEVNFGPTARLRKPELLVAHHADFHDRLDTLMTDVRTSILSSVRPTAGVTRAWLGEWKPSPKMGTIVAASGYLHINDVVASAPVELQDDNLTCLVASDSGLLRAEATIRLFGISDTKIALAADLTKKRFSAGIQLPEFTYGDFTVRAGPIFIGLGWGDSYFLVSVGWPEAINGDPLERDWSKSVMIRWAGATPINTFWGGVRVESIASNKLKLQLALRAGWTWAYSVTIGGVAKGSASLGVALGGTVEVTFTDSSRAIATPATPRALLAPAADARPTARAVVDAMLAAAATRDGDATRTAANAVNADLLAALQFAAPHIDANMRRITSISAEGQVNLYADIWGRASAELLGVRIASIDVGAHAAFSANFNFTEDLQIQILSVTARIHLHLEVRIGCFTTRAQAQITISIRDGASRGLPAAVPLAIPA